MIPALSDLNRHKPVRIRLHGRQILVLHDARFAILWRNGKHIQVGIMNVARDRPVVLKRELEIEPVSGVDAVARRRFEEKQQLIFEVHEIVRRHVSGDFVGVLKMAPRLLAARETAERAHG